MKRCANPDCGTLHSHPTRELCSKCSGWSCPDCGRPKTPQQLCMYVECRGRREEERLQVEKRRKREEKKARKEEENRNRNPTTLLPYRRYEP